MGSLCGMLWNMPIFGSNPASLVISSDRGSLYIHKDPWVTENRNKLKDECVFALKLVGMCLFLVLISCFPTLYLPTILSSSRACSSSSPAFPLYKLKVWSQSSKFPYSLSSSLLYTCTSANPSPVCICVCVIGLFLLEYDWYTHQQLVHFCFCWSFLRAVCSLTLLLVLGAFLFFALLLCLGAFQKNVIGFDV